MKKNQKLREFNRTAAKLSSFYKKIELYKSENNSRSACIQYAEGNNECISECKEELNDLIGGIETVDVKLRITELQNVMNDILGVDYTREESFNEYLNKTEELKNTISEIQTEAKSFSTKYLESLSVSV